MTKPSSSITTTITQSNHIKVSGGVGIHQLKTTSTTNLDNTGHIIINNKIYDISELIPIHPGGDVIRTYLGQDATDVFEAFHATSTHELLANYYLSDYTSPALKKDFHLTKQIRSLNTTYKQNHYYTPNPVFYLTQFMIAQGILYLSIIMLYNQYNYVSAALLGLFWQQSGWLSHDFLHHSISSNRTLNNLMGMVVGGVFQGFSISWWKNKHNKHHAQPNIVEHDPDIDTMPILAWSKPNLLRKLPQSRFTQILITYQSKLYFMILTFARTSWCIQSLLYSPQSVLEFGSLVLHWGWYLGMITLLIDNFVDRVIYFIASQACCGLMLALVFSLNHNGMAVFTDLQGQQFGFFQKQILTSRDIAPSMFMNWFCGGLNFQIEHHLFPQMPRHQYPKVQHDIQRLCTEFNVKHHVTGFWQGIQEVLHRLYHVSKVYLSL